MENVNSNAELENLATQAESEDVTKKGSEQLEKTGDHLPADLEKLRYENAERRALQLVGLLEWAIKKKDGRLSVPESAYDEAKPRLAPLLLKHNLDEFGLPEWLQPYREEVSALVFFVGIGAGIGMQMYELRKEDQEAAQAAADAGQAAPVRNEQTGGAFDWAKDQ